MRLPGLHRGSSGDADDAATPADDAGAGAAPASPAVPAVPARRAVADAALLADAVRAAVLGVPGVVALHPGAFGTVATYLPGRRVEGVQLRPGAGEVHVVLAVGADVLRTATRVHSAAESLVGGPVHVHVEDLVDVRPATSPPPLQET